MAELVTEDGRRIVRFVDHQGERAVYVNMGIGNEPVGFFNRTKKPIPSNPHKHWRLSTLFWQDEPRR